MAGMAEGQTFDIYVRVPNGNSDFSPPNTRLSVSHPGLRCMVRGSRKVALLEGGINRREKHHHES